MSEVTAVDERKPSKPFWQKLINKETFPTLWAAVTALNWVSSFMAISALAHYLYQKVDFIFSGFAQFISIVASPIVHEAQISSIKIALIIIGLFGFSASGMNKKSLNSLDKITNAEVLITFICGSFIGMLTIFKVVAISQNTPLSDMLRNFNVDKKFHDLLFQMSLTYMAPCIFSMTLFIVLNSIYKNIHKKEIYFTCVFAHCIALTVAAFAVTGRLGDMTSVILDMATLAVLSGPVFLLSINPKRLRQVTSFGILFIALAIIGIPFDQAASKLLDNKDSPNSASQLK